MSVDLSYIYRKSPDWKAKSVIDFSVFAGFGGGVKHLAIWSPTLKKGVHGAVLFAGFGGEAEAKVPKFDDLLGDSYDFMKGFIENQAKMVEGGAKSAGGYDSVTVFRAFSLYEFSVSTVALAEAGGAAVGGAKIEGLTVYCKTQPIFSIPPAIGAAWGLGAGAHASVGIILTSIQHQVSTKWRYELETRRKPTDMPVRPPGGYGAG